MRPILRPLVAWQMISQPQEAAKRKSFFSSFSKYAQGESVEYVHECDVTISRDAPIRRMRFQLHISDKYTKPSASIFDLK